ncbi:HET domain containing protein [Rhypophila sp. PSN 637]
MATYVYSQLSKGEIRLLTLEPRSDSDQAICRLEHRFHSSDLDYEALSYCWGVGDKAHQVFCEGKTIRVTASLFSALRNLSFRSKERRLWVDAICINQNDDLEKNHQVSMMGTVYSSASRTVVWLGDDKEVEAAVSRVQRLPLPIIPPSSATCSENLIRQIAPIFDCPWFQRLWVVQEVALASDCEFVVRQKQVSFDKISAVFVGITDRWGYQQLFNATSGVNFENINKIRSYIRARQTSRLFPLDLLRKTEGFRVTDKRDKLYALFGLSPVSKEFPIKYDDEVNDVFVKFAAWALLEFPDLALLSSTRGPDNELPAPSWASSYNMRGLPISFLAVESLFVWGAGALDSTNTSSANHDRNGRSDVDCSDTTASCPRAATIRRLAAALILESGDEGHILLTSVGEHIQGQQISYQHHKTLRDTLSIWARYRTLGYTSEGRLAWLPRRSQEPRPTEARVGDRICIFRGDRLPYVARPVGDGTYRLVGECWVQGMMQGEWVRDKEGKLDTVRLR